MNDVDKARRLLERALGPSKVLTSEEGRARFMRDESEADGVMPDAVVLAESSDDIAHALRVAAETELPITPRAAGTGRTGGAVPVSGGIVLATLGMNRIKDLDVREGRAVVEPGVVLADLHAASKPKAGSIRPIPTPPDPARWAATSPRTPAARARSSTGPRAITCSGWRRW